jgi:hypothetical protein
VRQAPNHGVAWRPLATAAPTPLVRLHDAARQDSTARLESLPGGLEAELVESAEHGQIRAGEARPRGSVRHVEVFRMGSVRTSILGRPRHLSGDRRADDLYTLICEEPTKVLRDRVVKMRVGGGRVMRRKRWPSSSSLGAPRRDGEAL